LKISAYPLRDLFTTWAFASSSFNFFRTPADVRAEGLLGQLVVISRFNQQLLGCEVFFGPAHQHRQDLKLALCQRD
jgi:hypothetical protein